MTHKFTADGRKVAVIGALNAKETIVQEIFVSDGTEFPAGEHFVTKTLLDAPAKTYKAAEELRVQESIKKLEAEKHKLEIELRDFRFNAQAAHAKLKWISGITDPEVEEAFERIRAMLCGEYTHVVFADSRIEIKEWGLDLFANRDRYYQGSFESLRLISLFGEWNGRLTMNWKVNSYRDGSGSWREFIPCTSLQEAVDTAQQLIDAKEYLSDEDYTFCLTFGILVDETKNAVRLEKKAAMIRERIAGSKAQTEKLEAELAALA